MVYIYKKTIKGRPYYYLRISKSVKGRTVVRDVAYLGSDASKIRQKLEELPAIYKKDIRKAYSNIEKSLQSEYYIDKARKSKPKENPYLDKRLLEEVEAIKLHFNEHFQRLDKDTKNETFKNFLIDFAFNTTSLEGNTITLGEANKLLKENLTPKNRTLNEIYDLKNTETVFFDILESKKIIDHEFIINVHDALLNGIDLRKGYRTHEIRVFKAHFEATPSVYIKTDMGILLKWQKENSGRFHPLALAGIFHRKFEKIHPFSDGNGRTGRMIMNYMLIKEGYPPFIIRKSRRAEYLEALAEGDRAGINEDSPKYYKKLIEYLAEEMIWGYWNNFLI